MAIFTNSLALFFPSLNSDFTFCFLPPLLPSFLIFRPFLSPSSFPALTSTYPIFAPSVLPSETSSFLLCCIPSFLFPFFLFSLLRSFLACYPSISPIIFPFILYAFQYIFLLPFNWSAICFLDFNVHTFAFASFYTYAPASI